MNTYHDNDNGSRLHLRVGEEFAVELPESLSGGYKWEVAESGTPVLKQTGVESQGASPLPGNPNLRTWRFVANQPGSAQLHLQHKRSWEANASGRQFSLAVNVAA